MCRLLLSLTVLAALAAFAVPALATTKSVKVDDNYYVRSSGVPRVYVERGDVVRWNFVGRSPHTVSSRALRFSSLPRTSGSYARRMTRVGRFTIFCEVHEADDMSMTLVVRDRD